MSEETFEMAHKVICERLLYGNKGKNISKRDTQGKIICAHCDKSYYICHSRSLGSALNTNPYYICGTKKNKGKKVCDAENLSLKHVESYLEELRIHDYDNVDLRNKAKIHQLKSELYMISNITDIEITKSMTANKKLIDSKQEAIGQLLDRFLGNATESTKKTIEKRIDSIEEEILKVELESKMLDELLRDKEAEKKNNPCVATGAVKTACRTNKRGTSG